MSHAFILLIVSFLTAVLSAADADASYVLGPEDQISIQVVDGEELFGRAYRIGLDGIVALPLAGPVKAAGLTIRQFESELKDKLGPFFVNPQVVVTLEEGRSQPVTVVGAVNLGGVHQIRGQMRLFDIVSLAGGLRADAGHKIKITRQLSRGELPLANAQSDATRGFSVGEVSVTGIIEGRRPEENIIVQPHDLITVPKGEMVYVMGEVTRAGGYVLDDRQSVSLLQALGISGGLTRFAASHSARLLRLVPGKADRREIPVDLKAILAGKKPDMALLPADILFVPSNAGKQMSLRALEAAINIGTGIAIWGR